MRIVHAITIAYAVGEFGCGGRERPRDRNQENVRTDPEVVISKIASFAERPSGESFEQLFGRGRERRDLGDGWRSYRAFLGAEAFTCDAMLVATSAGSVAAWGYECGPLGRKELPESVTARIPGEWFDTDRGQRRFGKRHDVRSSNAVPIEEPQVRIAFEYLDSPLNELEIGPACPRSDRSIGAPRAETSLQILEQAGTAGLIEQLLVSASPEGRFLAAEWVVRNPKRVSAESSALRASDILSSSTDVTVRFCGPADRYAHTYSLLVPMRDARRALKLGHWP